MSARCEMPRGGASPHGSSRLSSAWSWDQGGVLARHHSRSLQGGRRPPAPCLDADVAFELMFRVSEIMIATVVRCPGQSVVVLPIHEGLLVRKSKAQAAREAIRDVFAEHNG